MSATQIDNAINAIRNELMKRYGCTTADRDLAPLTWYINSGRASLGFLRQLFAVRPVLVARDLHKGGSYDETLARIFSRINYRPSV